MSSGITAKRTADYLRIGAVPNRDAERDRGVAGVGVGCAITFVIAEKQLPDRAVMIPADRTGIVQAGNLNLEGLGESSLR
jgi:hypothetical protein